MVQGVGALALDQIDAGLKHNIVFLLPGKNVKVLRADSANERAVNPDRPSLSFSSFNRVWISANWRSSPDGSVLNRLISGEQIKLDVKWVRSPFDPYFALLKVNRRSDPHRSPPHRKVALIFGTRETTVNT